MAAEDERQESVQKERDSLGHNELPPSFVLKRESVRRNERLEQNTVELSCRWNKINVIVVQHAERARYCLSRMSDKNIAIKFFLIKNI